VKIYNFTLYQYILVLQYAIATLPEEKSEALCEHFLAVFKKVSLQAKVVQDAC
jgi:hypothetical protein